MLSPAAITRTMGMPSMLRTRSPRFTPAAWAAGLVHCTTATPATNEQFTGRASSLRGESSAETDSPTANRAQAAASRPVMRRRRWVEAGFMPLQDPRGELAGAA